MIDRTKDPQPSPTGDSSWPGARRVLHVLVPHQPSNDGFSRVAWASSSLPVRSLWKSPANKLAQPTHRSHRATHQSISGTAPVILGLALAFVSSSAIAQTEDQPPSQPNVEKTLNAPEVVRSGNQLLNKGDATGALEAYERATELRPEARELAFVRGLAHYDLGEYEKARENFMQAAATASDPLSDDARYSLATCDHAEALLNQDDPQRSLSLLEDSMKQYQNVLANRPDHKEARDANYKAASLWRQIKQMLEQQPPQDQECDNENENEDNEDQEKKDQKQSENEENEDQEQKDQQQQDDQQQQEKQDEEKQQQQESQESEQQNDEQQQQQQAAAEKEERISREQAERKLREMMQAMRERQKKRRKAVRRIPMRPVDKDW